MPFKHKSFPEATDGSPQSATMTDIDSPRYSPNGVDHSNGNSNGLFSPSTDVQAPSPIEIRSEKSGSRKRHRESPTDEDETPKRRQDDDYTPKHKKRQPKVAEAYR